MENEKMPEIGKQQIQNNYRILMEWNLGTSLPSI